MLQTLLPRPDHNPTTNQPPYAQCRPLPVGSVNHLPYTTHGHQGLRASC